MQSAADINGRLFTFGCSFTAYNWPTWADLIGREFNQFQNWAMAGGGNQFIFNSFVECHLKNKISKNDVVGIMWTNPTREDRYVDKQWVLPGNIYTQDIYDSKFIKQFADTRGYYLRDLAVIYAADKMLEQIGCKYYFLSMVPMTNLDQYTLKDVANDLQDVLPYYMSTLKKFYPSVFEVVFNFNWGSRVFLADSAKLDKIRKDYQKCAGPDWPSFDQYMNMDFKGIAPEIVSEILDDSRWAWKKQLASYKRLDSHPTPLEHIEYVDKVLGSSLISDDTRQWADTIEQRIRSHRDYFDLWKFSPPERW